MPKILMPYTVHLDHTLRVTPVSTLFYKGDSKAHRFELNVLSKGLQADLSGCTAVYRFYRLQDRTVVSNPASIESGKVVAVLDKACYDYIGRFALTIAIQNGEEETTVFYGDGYMSGNRADTGITGDYVVYDVETLLAKIAEIETAIANANTATENANTATENGRVQQEQVAQAEASRVSAENARATAESERVAAEKKREGHESTRDMQEHNRMAAETIRDRNETNRNTAETARKEAETARNDAETARAAAEEARDAAEADRDAAEQARQETFAGYEDRIVAATPDDTTVGGRSWSSKKTVDSLCMPIEATGNPVQVYPVEGYPLGVKVSWEPAQAGSGDPSPDNIRPITGLDAVSVTRSGKNLIKSTALDGQQINLSARIQPGDTITVSFDGVAKAEGDRVTIYTHDTDGTLEGSVSFTTKAGPQRYTGTRTLNRGVGISYLKAYSGSDFYERFTSVTNFKVELGSTATPYEPYTGSTTDITLPETVYGGTLNVETGVITINRATVIIDGDKIFFKEGTYWNSNNNSTPNIMNGVSWNNKIVCSHFYKVFGSNSNNDFIYCEKDIMKEYFATVDDFNAYLAEQNAAGTPVQVCYILDTPYTIQLTPQQIAALSGVNTIYTDAGTLTVTGREDPRHTIVTLTDRIAALESAAAGV